MITKEDQIEAARKRFQEAIKRTRHWRDSIVPPDEPRKEEPGDPPSHRRTPIKTQTG